MESGFVRYIRELEYLMLVGKDVQEEEYGLVGKTFMQ